MATGRFVVSWPILLEALHLPADTILAAARTGDPRLEPHLVLTVEHPDITQLDLEPVYAKASDGSVQFVRWTREVA
jgi:hypothetical protein